METAAAPVNGIRALSNLSNAEWEVALKRYYIILPLIDNEPGFTIASVARKSKVTRQTIYRWLERYTQTQSVSSLLKDDTGCPKGTKRIAVDTETIVEEVINSRYLNKQKLSLKKATIDVTLKCREAGLPVPHYSTVRRRIAQISEEQKLARRYDSSIAGYKYDPLLDQFPNADYPLAAVQIDHTKLDILVVDEINRECVGRPWITLAIDVYSRMVVGFYISLDPPGVLGTGLCLSHAILPKELWLSRLDVPGKWPCHGVMRSLYMDNAREFRGRSLERSCQEYGIEINFRPVTKPHYGGHIERLMGTVLREIHALPGTTFSNIKDRKHYDSEGKACFTLTELEKWVADFIVGVYHQRKHSGIGTTPLARYNEGISGNLHQIGVGKDIRMIDELKLKLDFMPFEERTVQRYGVSIDGIAYYGDILRKWIHAYNQPNSMDRSKRKFAFKRDPRDISTIYFYDPETEQYYDIRYRNTSYPSITIWEHKEILRVLKAQGISRVDENIIFETYARLRNMENSAVNNTASAKRRRNQTRKNYATANNIRNQFMQVVEPDDTETEFKYDPNAVYLPFEDLEHDPFNKNKSYF
ncbi:putative transposase [Mucilaginibacter yixingensis]|uniref:Putative transposase n=1 Tax=Mucilaginibacter yixingensis TaxID=1295612 RepID=A0A2T5J4F8_9SPHI|nr:Mu transposase C-terminal domain-containing protein [Mucilaginibacter yixingensis]PTQ92278.1 putative transposase [Mucilaginibacter yixingensis]